MKRTSDKNIALSANLLKKNVLFFYLCDETKFTLIKYPDEKSINQCF